MKLKQAYIINSDLKMSAGKIGVQTAHGAILYAQHACDHGHSSEDEVYARYLKWFEGEDGVAMKKVVLKATELEMVNFTWILKNKGIWAHPVIDVGLTQVEPDSFTCLVVESLPEEECDKLFGHLKLL